MAIININQNVLVFDDEDTATNNPKRRNVDWTTNITGIPVKEPSSREYTLQPGETSTVFSGVRALTLDDTTTFSLSLNAVAGSVYRLTATAGTAPGFRTLRAIDLTGETVTVTVNNNATAEFVLPGSSTETFAGAVAGDVLFIPDATTGDPASPFNVMNVGFWTVLSVATRKLIAKRLNGESFQGVSEGPIAVASASEFQVFSAAGVQAGDTLNIVAGFSPISQKSYVISRVTPSWVEFTSTESLPLETGVTPDDTGLAIYSSAKSFVRVEVDQEAVVRINGDTGDWNRLSPRDPGVKSGIAHFEIWGNVYQLVIVNKSTSDSLKATVISVVKAY
jgi:hypothetical protein